jgi:hypothetical protein
MLSDWKKTFRQISAEFWVGFIELSKTSFVSLVIAAMLTFSVMVWLFSPTTLASPNGSYAARVPKDAEAFATVEAIRLANQAQERPRLLLLGASTTAQSLGDPRMLADELRKYPGAGAWDIHMLATPLQSRLDQLTLIETALSSRKIDDPPVVIAIGIAVYRLGFPRDRLIELEQTARLGIRSDWADEELAKLGAEPRRRSNFYFVENFQFVVKNLPVAFLRFILRDPAERLIAAYSEGPVLPIVYRPRELTRSQIEWGQSDLDSYLEFWKRLHDRLDEMPNVYLMFMDERLSPDFLSESGSLELSNQINERFRAGVSKFGSVFLETMKHAEFSPSDYHDDYHINNGEPQKRERAAFAKDFAVFAQKVTSGSK